MMANQLTAFFAVFTFIGILSLMNCMVNSPEDEVIRVESVQLQENLKQGVTIEIGSESINIAGKVTVLPENATIKTETYASSNLDVATVDAHGNIKIIGTGTATITVVVNEKSDLFTLTAIENTLIPDEDQQIQW